MTKPRVIATRRWPQAVEDRLAELFDATLNTDDHLMSHDELRAAARDYDAVLPTVSDKLPGDFLNGADRRVKILGSYGVGFNHIDLDAAKRNGVVVTNTPGVLTDCTADLAMTLLMATARRIGEGEREVRAGAWSGWRPTHMIGTKVTGATLGVIGFGRIGKAMAKRAHFGFDMKVVFFDPFPVDPAEAAKYGATQLATVEEVAAASDFVSMHCPGGAETRHIMSRGAIAAMRPHAIFVNSARGDVVDEEALVEALAAGRIAGAGLDVYEREPQIPEQLAKLDNVVLAPHLGSATMSTRVAMGMTVVDNLLAFFDGKEPPNRVA